MALTDTKAKAAKLGEDRKAKKYHDGGGLFLLVQKSGKYWKLKYRFAGKEKSLSIGIYPQVSLKQARAEREQAKETLANGADPSQAKKEAKRQQVAAEQAATFEGVALEWIKTKGKQLKASTIKHRLAELNNHILPWIGSMKLAAIKPMDVLDVCRRIEKCGHNEAAHRAKMLIGQVMRYGVATGRIESDPTRDINGALEPVITKHRPCLIDPKEVGGLLRAITAHKGTFIVHSALLLTPYVMLRPKELRTLEWQYIDLEAATITIPADKMKMKAIHIVPLPRQALAILKDTQALTGGGKYVFHGARTASRPMSDAAINATLRAIGYCTKTQQCAHGFRGTASTLLHELGFNTDYIERQLAHKEGNAIKAAYNHARHLPERKAMLQHYADYLDGLRDGAQVIPINKKTA